MSKGLLKIVNPLPVQIPPHYAALLGIDPTHLYRCNLGTRHFSIPLCCKLMDFALKDPDLAGLSFFHLRPELKPALPHLCPKKKGRNRAGR